MWKQADSYLRKILHILPFIIIAIGIALRITVYLQNRSLIIDEANVARNLFERDFAGLTLPLKYEQYAPPVFLWLLKLSATVFGFSEYALKLYPLLCGIGVLILIYKVLKQYTHNTSIWYVLALIASGWIYLRYSTEVKQYMSDAFVMLSLILLTLKLDISKVAPGKFLLYWALIGSVTIWLSMPSVFMLTAIGLYYFYLTIKERRYNKIGLLAGVGVVWAVQFVFYYLTILQPQIHSSHLQHGHSLYFLIPFPSNTDEWMSNWGVFSNVLGNAAGHWALSLVFHMLTLVVGAVYMLRKQTAKAILIVVPLLLPIVGAAFHQFTLMPRVVVFMMPLLMILIAKGLEGLYRIPFKPFGIAVTAVAIICIVNFNRLDLFVNRLETEEIKQCMDFLQRENITGEQLYIHEMANPAYIYYTTIHPQEQIRRKSLKGATLLTWRTNYDELAPTMKGRFGLLHSWIEYQETYDAEQAKIRQYSDLDTSFQSVNTHVLIYKSR